MGLSLLLRIASSSDKKFVTNNFYLFELLSGFSAYGRASRGEFAISFNGETMPNIDAGTSEASRKQLDDTRRAVVALYHLFL